MVSSEKERNAVGLSKKSYTFQRKKNHVFKCL